MVLYSSGKGQRQARIAALSTLFETKEENMDRTVDDYAIGHKKQPCRP